MDRKGDPKAAQYKADKAKVKATYDSGMQCLLSAHKLVTPSGEGMDLDGPMKLAVFNALSPLLKRTTKLELQRIATANAGDSETMLDTVSTEVDIVLGAMQKSFEKQRKKR